MVCLIGGRIEEKRHSEETESLLISPLSCKLDIPVVCPILTRGCEPGTILRKPINQEEEWGDSTISHHLVYIFGEDSEASSVTMKMKGR